MSQLLIRLEDHIRTAQDLQTRGRLNARKAAYFARIGRFAEAKELIAALRVDFGMARSCAVTPWIMWAEGVLHYFEDLGPRALDRFARTQLLALAMEDSTLAAIASAWKAQTEFERSLFEQMGKSLLIADEQATTLNHTARSRMGMVMCNCLLLCGEKELGQTWFVRCRDHAVNEGDQAGIEAIVYNRAAFNLAWCRAQNALGVDVAESLPLIRMELASAKNYLQLTGIISLNHMIDFSESRLLLLEQKFDAAISQLDSLHGTSPYSEFNYSPALINLERAYCRFRLGSNDPEIALSTSGWPQCFEKLDIDEQLAAASIVRELTDAGVSGLATAEVEQNFDRITKAYKANNERIMRHIRPMCENH